MGTYNTLCADFWNHACMEGRLDPIGRNRRPTEHAAVSACCGLRKPSGNGTDHDRRQSCIWIRMSIKIYLVRRKTWNVHYI